jgi:stress-induced morphogen
MITVDEIETALRAAFPDASVLRVVDTTGTMDHFDALIVSARFAGLSKVRQHQLIYEALGDRMKVRIHALALRTYTPEVWARMGA